MADKGLKSNVVGLFGGTMLGISSVAPAYTSTITIGLLVAAVGAKTPFVFIAWPGTSISSRDHSCEAV
jgi:hypothetical protein